MEMHPALSVLNGSIYPYLRQYQEKKLTLFAGSLFNTHQPIQNFNSGINPIQRLILFLRRIDKNQNKYK